MTAEHERTIQARRVLLDGLEALAAHRRALILVGAQAVYLRTDQRQLTFSAGYTTDADLAVDPGRLGPVPLVEDALRAAGFELKGGDRPGIWATQAVVDDAEESLTIDLLVPEAVAGAGTRSASVPPHDQHSLTRARGLKAALVDHDPLTVAALDPGDTRLITLNVAGLAALLVAKLHKLTDRLNDTKHPGRVRPKDAGDVYRILLALDPDDAAVTLRRLLADPVSGPPTAESLDHLRDLFGGARRPGVALAVDALAGDVPANRVAAVCVESARRLRDLPS